MGDGLYCLESITKEDDYTYCLHVEMIDKEKIKEFNSNIIPFYTFPTNDIVFYDENENDDAINVQFVGINNKTVNSYPEIVRFLDVLNYDNKFYLNEYEWYNFYLSR